MSDYVKIPRQKLKQVIDDLEKVISKLEGAVNGRDKVTS